MSGGAARVVPDKQTRLLRRVLLVSRRRSASDAVFGADRPQRAACARDAARSAASGAPAGDQLAPQRVPASCRQQRHDAHVGRRRRSIPTR